MLLGRTRSLLLCRALLLKNTTTTTTSPFSSSSPATTTMLLGARGGPMMRAGGCGLSGQSRASGVGGAIPSSSSSTRAISTTAARASSSGNGDGSGNGGAAAAPTTAPTRRPRVLSGVQPTGRLHLGNYLGAIRNWVALQDTHDAFFCVVDLHAVTNSPHDPRELREATRAMAAAYIAAGVDPSKAKIFVQSHVPAHTELAWLLECVTPVGWLGRMTQFKDKSRKMQQKQQEAAEAAGKAGGGGGGESGSGSDNSSSGGGENNASVGTGLMTYPVLMAADILLYQADRVPVGEDQKQHLELARDLATRVNSQFGGKGWKKRGGRGGRLLTVPEPMIPPAGARVMSLLDGTSKMSKSADNDASRVNLTDTPEVIAAKIRRCKTDSIDGIVASDQKNRPEAANLLAIYALCTNQTVAQAEAECGSLRWGDFKPRLSEALVEHLRPFQTRYKELTAEPLLLDGVLADGAEAASEVADRTLWDVRDAMGFVPPRRALVRRVPVVGGGGGGGGGGEKKEEKKQQQPAEAEAAAV
jgi:tryptophanyl-tRNA synthetase